MMRNSPLLHDLTGQRFGRLVVVSRGPDSKNTARTRRWFCICDCGLERLVASTSLKSGGTVSCGCIRRKEGAVTRKPEYAIWQGILNRCRNSNVRSFKNYGGRGISVAPEWQTFEQFYADMGPRPSTSHSVERKDVDGNYGPGNCLWATAREQCNNRRNTRRVMYRGELMPLAEAVRRAGSVIHIEAAWVRLRTGWTPEAALETPRRCESPASRMRAGKARAA